MKVTEEVDIFFFFCQTKKIAGAIEIVDIVTAEGKCQTLKEDWSEVWLPCSPFQDMKDYAPIAAVTFQLQGSRTARIRQQEDSDR